MLCVVLLVRIFWVFFHVLLEAPKKAENHQSRGKIQIQPAYLHPKHIFTGSVLLLVIHVLIQ